MSEYGFHGNPEMRSEGGAHREKRSTPSLIEVATKLRALISRAQAAGDRREGVRELHQMLLAIHPDVSPGKTPEEAAAFERLAKIATQVLSWYRDDRPASSRDVNKCLDELSDIESKFGARGTSQASGDRPFRAGPGDSEWWPGDSEWWPGGGRNSGTTEDEEEEEKPPYETEDIEFGPAFVGKRMFEVEIDLEDDVAEFVLDPENRGNDYRGLHALSYFEIEGVDGVVVAYSSSEDEYRSAFGGWKVIKGLVGRRIRGLGVVESFREVDEEDGDSLDGYDRGTRVRLSNGTIRFGTRAYDAYYPSGYCDFEAR